MAGETRAGDEEKQQQEQGSPSVGLKRVNSRAFLGHGSHGVKGVVGGGGEEQQPGRSSLDDML